MRQTGQGQNVHEFMDVQTYVFPETRFPQDVGQGQPEGRIQECIRMYKTRPKIENLLTLQVQQHAYICV